MRVGIDIDGVLYPWSEAANRAVMVKFDLDDPGPHTSWNYLRDAIGAERFGWCWTPHGQETIFSELTIYPGARRAFSDVLDSGHECHFVTHRDPAIAGLMTARYLDFHFAGHRWAGTHVVKSTPKHTLAEWDVFIDDKAETVLEMLAKTSAQVFAPARPWNGELAGLDTPRLIVYDDPAQVAEWVASR